MRTKVCIAIALLLLTYSCKWDHMDPIYNCSNVDATWTTGVAPIIASHCAIAGCHESGATMGDYTTYQGVKAKVDNGTFELRVFQLQVMPPASQPDLTEEEYAQLKCWFESGSPQN